MYTSQRLQLSHFTVVFSSSINFFVFEKMLLNYNINYSSPLFFYLYPRLNVSDGKAKRIYTIARSYKERGASLKLGVQVRYPKTLHNLFCAALQVSLLAVMYSCVGVGVLSC